MMYLRQAARNLERGDSNTGVLNRPEGKEKKKGQSELTQVHKDWRGSSREPDGPVE